MNITDVGEYLIVNQGSIRLARFMSIGRTRTRVSWQNSKRTMVRDVNVVYTIIGWLERPNTRVLPVDKNSPLRAYVGKRLSAVAVELKELGRKELGGNNG